MVARTKTRSPLTPQQQAEAERLWPIALRRAKRWEWALGDEAQSIASLVLVNVVSLGTDRYRSATSIVYTAVDRACRKAIKRQHITNCELGAVPAPDDGAPISHAVPDRLVPVLELRLRKFTRHRIAQELGKPNKRVAKELSQLAECLS